jgi:hypothetical protein
MLNKVFGCFELFIANQAVFYHERSLPLK